jgi:hypothetical protein
MSSALSSTDQLPAPGEAVAPGGTTSTRAGRPADLRAGRPYLAPVPDCEPPFDDERSAVSRLNQLRTGSAARNAAAAAPSVPRAPAARPVPGSSPVPGSRPTGLVRVPDTVHDTAVPGWSQDSDMGVRRTATAKLPPATRSGPVLARALVEVVSGQRPLAQLRVHCAPEVFAGLQGRPIARGALGHLLNVRVCEPADGVAEVSVAFRRGERVRAMAFRIQGVDGRWRVTALETG